MNILELPTELLVLILEEVGGRELRRGHGVGARRLTVCRRWYRAARAVYLSGLEFANVMIKGHSLESFNTSLRSGSARSLMHKNTRNLHIRSYGHWWDTKDFRTDDDSGRAHEKLPPVVFDPDDSKRVEGSVKVEDWQSQEMMPSLDRIFEDLKSFTALEIVQVDFFTELIPERGPQWGYLPVRTLHRLYQNLPFGYDLTTLSIDISNLAMMTGAAAAYDPGP
jgi:hypothetical protein